ncbi:ATP-binding protein [Roseomonas sp. AR75]|uniref:ATP-binding protein n=1 Tax=Roseomonas sp. AR75 TaxID=2562311 RepID=UPI0010C1060A|nr:ATP-binding protein [Roseomonas sp. AR75]
MAASPDGAEREIRILNRLDQIADVAAFVEAFGNANDLPENLVNALNVALDEALSNAMSYGFPDGGSHVIIVSLGCCGGEVWAEVMDDGIPFDPLASPTAPDLGQALHDRKVGGLGLLFMRHLMDDVSYRREGGFNRLRLRIKVGAAAPRGEGATGASEAG